MQQLPEMCYLSYVTLSNDFLIKLQQMCETTKGGLDNIIKE